MTPQAFKEFNQQYPITDLNTGEKGSTEKTGIRGHSVHGFGIEVAYRPLGLSFTYVPRTGDEETAVNSHFFSFKWMKKWGGERE